MSTATEKTTAPPPAKPLTPDARRRHEARAGHEIVLADGNAWEFPGPLVRLSRVVAEDGTASLKPRVIQSAEYTRKLDLLHDTDEDTPGAQVVMLQLELASDLLRQNYDMTDAEAGSLIELGYDPGDTDEQREMTDAVLAVIHGGTPRGPKSDTGAGVGRA